MAEAEYINRNLIEWYGCDFEDASCENRECSGCSHAECFQPQVMQIPTADVVERSEYIESQKEVMRLRDLCHKVNQDAMNYEGMYKELHSKIDKAIKEIEGLVKSSKLPTVNIYNRYSEGLEDCLDILKRNIGE